jgi:predicted porin
MKKSLLALAVAAALPAAAQAQSNITLYGIADVGLEYSNGGANSTNTQAGKSGIRVQSSLGTGSRLGIRGSENLGGGLSAIFQIEHRFSIDTGDTAGGNVFLLPGATNTAFNNKFWNGIAWAGIQGGWGRVTLGRQYTPIFDVVQPADFAAYQYYNNWSFTQGDNIGGAAGAFVPMGPVRTDNSIKYTSPSFGGLTVVATYAFGENYFGNTPGCTVGAGGVVSCPAVTGSDINGTQDVWGIAAGWKMGGLYLAGGYHSFSNKVPFTSNGALFGTQNTVYKDVWLATASYDFGGFGLSLGYSVSNFEQQFSAATALGKPSLSNILFSAYAKFGPGRFIVNGYYSDVQDFRSAAAVNAKGGDALNLGLTYAWPLSNRTTLYATVGLNDTSPLLANNVTVNNDIDGRQRYAIGLQHRF